MCTSDLSPSPPWPPAAGRQAVGDGLREDWQFVPSIAFEELEQVVAVVREQVAEWIATAEPSFALNHPAGVWFAAFHRQWAPRQRLEG
jgi:hypothetical protein